MGLKISELYKSVCELLKKAEIESYEFETNCIIEAFCGIKREERIKNSDHEISEEEYRVAFEAAQKRSSHYPLQYILKSWDFYGRNFKVGKGVLIPRADTEILCEHALEYMKDKSGFRTIIDLFSGSGCVAVTLDKELKKTKIYAIEIDEDAYAYLDLNIKYLKSKVVAKNDDAASAYTPQMYKEIDLITANPPYLTANDMAQRQEEVTYEPFTALYGGGDGLYFYRKIIKLWKSSLKRGGMMAVEVGRDQYRAVGEIFRENGYRDLKTRKDYSGIVRVVSGIR